MFLAPNLSIDKLKKHQKLRIWEEICDLAFLQIALQTRKFYENILKGKISFYAFFRNENLQILEFYFRENILLKFYYKVFLDPNLSIDDAKITSKLRIWKEICGLAFCKLHYKLGNFNDNIPKNDISFYAFSEPKIRKY